MSPHISFIILDKLTVIRILIIDYLLAGRFHQEFYIRIFIDPNRTCRNGKT